MPVAGGRQRERERERRESGKTERDRKRVTENLSIREIPCGSVWRKLRLLSNSLIYRER